MTPELEAHLDRMFTLSLRADALAGALNSIIGDPDLLDATTAIAQALSNITSTISYGLDTPARFGVAA